MTAAPSIQGIVLVPPDDDPDDLLKGGVGGSRPPLACFGGRPERWNAMQPDAISPCREIGLLLGWERQAVRPGLNHATDASAKGEAEVVCGWPSSNEPPPEGLPESLWRAWEAAASFRAHGMGRIVLVDDAGQEVT